MEAAIETIDRLVGPRGATEQVAARIRSDRGIGNLDQILSVDGVDGAVIGRADLSADLGLPGQTNHPEVVRRVERMIAACQQHRKIPGLLVQDVASAKEWIAKGIRLVPYANEVSLLVGAGSRAVGEIRSFVKESRGEWPIGTASSGGVP